MVMKPFWTDQRKGVGAHILSKHCRYLRKKFPPQEREIKVLAGDGGEDSPCIPQGQNKETETWSP